MIRMTSTPTRTKPSTRASTRSSFCTLLGGISGDCVERLRVHEVARRKYRALLMWEDCSDSHISDELIDAVSEKPFDEWRTSRTSAVPRRCWPFASLVLCLTCARPPSHILHAQPAVLLLTAGTFWPALRSSTRSAMTARRAAQAAARRPLSSSLRWPRDPRARSIRRGSQRKPRVPTDSR